MTSPKPERFGVHYETIPHGNCHDAKRCDCDCPGCVKDRGGTCAEVDARA